MVSFWSSVFAASLVLTTSVLASPLRVHPGNRYDLIITSDNTINGTTGAGGAQPQISSDQQLGLAFVNNLPSSGLNAYVTGLDPNNAVVLLQPNGQWYYPNANGATTPVPITDDVAIPLGGQGSTTNIQLPDYISSARVWVSDGTLQFFVVADANGNTGLVEPSVTNPQDPSANVDWGFVELTNTEDGGLYANISFVDFVGLVLGMTLLTASGATQSAGGLTADAVSQICSALESQAAADGQPWDQLCVKDTNGNPLRVLAPTDYISIQNSAFSDYWTDYVNQVWSTYSSQPLTINTQGAAGDVSCTVTDGMLNCDGGDNRGYAQPAAIDIFGCNSGPFAIEAGDTSTHAAVVPRLCAAFDRSTLLLDGGNVQPGLNYTYYYTTDPTNYYSKFVHAQETDGKGYAFSYDDVNPDGENQSGVVSDPNPQTLTVTIGGPSS